MSDDPAEQGAKERTGTFTARWTSRCRSSCSSLAGLAEGHGAADARRPLEPAFPTLGRPVGAAPGERAGLHHHERDVRRLRQRGGPDAAPGERAAGPGAARAEPIPGPGPPAPRPAARERVAVRVARPRLRQPPGRGERRRARRRRNRCADRAASFPEVSRFSLGPRLTAVTRTGDSPAPPVIGFDPLAPVSSRPLSAA